MDVALGRTAASDATAELGWRFLLGTLRTAVRVESLTRGTEIARLVIDSAGGDADHHLRIDHRADRLILTLQSEDSAAVSARDAQLAAEITAAVRTAGLDTTPDLGTAAARSVQIIEVAIDALDIPTIRPFWKAVLGYVDEPGHDGPTDPLVDPYGQSPSIWFQQMDAPRPQRNRIHLDVCVPHDEASHRIEVALAAGGRLLSDTSAPAFWVLADDEGNEACITTWQGRGD